MADLIDRAHHFAVDGIVQDLLDEAAVDLGVPLISLSKVPVLSVDNYSG
jgi:hypothetical protein